MFVNTTPSKIRVSANSLFDSPALSGVVVWLLFRNGQQAGRVLWVLSTGNDGNCIWKCAIECAAGQVFGINKSQGGDIRLTGQVIGKSHNSAGNDQIASFTDCLLKNGLGGYGLDCHNSNAAQMYLQKLGFQVCEAL